LQAGDLKENKKPFLKATRRPEAVVWLPIAKATKSGLLFSGGFAAYHNIFCLTSLHNACYVNRKQARKKTDPFVSYLKNKPEGCGLASDRPQGHGLASFGQSHSQSHNLG